MIKLRNLLIEIIVGGVMKPGTYQLETGRTVWVDQVLIRRAAIGVYIGSKERVRKLS